MTKIIFNQCLAENIKVFCADLIPYLQKRSSFEIEYDANLKFHVCRQRILDDEIQFVWLCGLLYNQLRDYENGSLKPLVAPILQGDTTPIYSSYLVSHKSSLFDSATNLEGASLAYNEESSFSGYHLLRYHFKDTDTKFSDLIASGGHQQSIELVSDGKADLAAIDTTFFDYLSREKPEVIEALQVIKRLEDFPIPPILVNQTIDSEIEQELKNILLTIDKDVEGLKLLQKHAVSSFVEVDDGYYDAIRHAFKTGRDL